MRIALCLPNNHPFFEKPFTKSLISVIQSFYVWNYEHCQGKHSLAVFVHEGGWIDFMRERLAEMAVDSNVDATLWLDTDMEFPPDIIARMVAHFEQDPSLDAVTGLYTWKQPPFMPHVYSSFNQKTGKFGVAGGFPLDKCFPVKGAGFGCVMIKTKVFTDLPKPWFDFKYDEYGEDLYFFSKALHINMVCDPTISCNHNTQIQVNIQSYLDFNQLALKDGYIDTTPEQLKTISDFHVEHNRGGKEKLEKKTIHRK